MTNFLQQARLAEDVELRSRATACAAGRGIPTPAEWTQQHMWQLATTPGWCCAASDADGRSSAITDAMIATAVDDILAAETPPDPPSEDPEESPAQ
ncbi:hypothetical protein Leucomu_05770 [Leucobacter muris]|uniref:Uncharacterized protein n=1 Tax=Leucobacter muris TaxID=1935379 RepID=A0ABX5QEQ0_9MICO|nr:hypothetical protein [Leucobacter muris]QAB17493.1 hypothetical protein Leucomu_05770 [Leucobacter muris]